MKSILYLLLTIAIFTAVAFNTNKDEQQANEQTNKTTDVPTSVQTTKPMSSDLTKGLDKVLTSLETLKTKTEETNVEIEKVNSGAEKLGENWDQIEKQVEGKYPEDYENIEKSLYPLLAEAKKDNPNLVLVTQLLDETATKIQVFKETIGTTPS